MVNKALVLSLMQEVIGDKNINAIDKYIDETYIQHNPYSPDGRAALKEFLGGLFKGKVPKKVEVLRVAADGDLVFVHWRDRGEFFGTESSFIEIWRIENGKLVEHWDVIQGMPDKSQIKSAHPLF